MIIATALRRIGMCVLACTTIYANIVDIELNTTIPLANHQVSHVVYDEAELGQHLYAYRPSAYRADLSGFHAYACTADNMCTQNNATIVETHDCDGKSACIITAQKDALHKPHQAFVYVPNGNNPHAGNLFLRSFFAANTTICDIEKIITAACTNATYMVSFAVSPAVYKIETDRIGLFVRCSPRADGTSEGHILTVWPTIDYNDVHIGRQEAEQRLLEKWAADRTAKQQTMHTPSVEAPATTLGDEVANAIEPEQTPDNSPAWRIFIDGVEKRTSRVDFIAYMNEHKVGDIDQLWPNGLNPLAYALHTNNAPAVALLLSCNADPYAVDHNEPGSFEKIVSETDPEIIGCLFDYAYQEECADRAPHFNKWHLVPVMGSLLEKALRGENTELLKKMADSRHDVCLNLLNGQLEQALAQSDQNKLAYLTPVCHQDFARRHGMTMTQYAISNNPELLEVFLKAEPALAAGTMSKTESPLCLALRIKNGDAIQALIYHGAPIGKTEIAIAKQTGSMPILVSLLENMRKASPLIKQICLGASPAEIEQFVQQNPAMLVAQTTDGLNAIDFAELTGQSAVTDILKKQQQRIHLTARIDAAAFEEALESSNGDLALIMLDNRAFIIDAPLPNGETPLTLAVKKSHPGVVQKLLELDADPNAENTVHQRPLDLARTIQNADDKRAIVKALFEKGAQTTAKPALPGATERAQLVPTVERTEMQKQIDGFCNQVRDYSHMLLNTPFAPLAKHGLHGDKTAMAEPIISKIRAICPWFDALLCAAFEQLFGRPAPTTMFEDIQTKGFNCAREFVLFYPLALTLAHMIANDDIGPALLRQLTPDELENLRTYNQLCQHLAKSLHIARSVSGMRKFAHMQTAMPPKQVKKAYQVSAALELISKEDSWSVEADSIEQVFGRLPTSDVTRFIRETYIMDERIACISRQTLDLAANRRHLREEIEKQRVARNKKSCL